nr:hypothetical protein [Tanacetum cinerariifolium]
MNDKSKDTTKARQDLKNLGIRSELWLGKNKNRKCSKPLAKYSFRPENRKKFCQFIIGVKLPDGFGSNFKHKVTNNDSNRTCQKSYDCHIMMQRLLPYGLQQYLPSSVATPIIKLCLFFKQIFSRTLMETDMVKAQSQMIDILCNLELIYPPAFFNIMIYLVIHLPLEALEGGSIPPVDIRQRYIYKDPSVSESGELFALACGPTPSPISVNSSVVNSVRFVVHSRDERCTTQNNGICLPGHKIKRFVIRNNITQIEAHDDQYILATQVKQVLYLKDMARRPPDWKVIQDVNRKKLLNGGVTVVEDDHNVIHFENSSDLALSTSLDDLDFATLNIDGQSMDVDTPPDITPDIIDVNEDDDLIDDEDALPHDLADSNDEDLSNDDDDDVAIVYSNVARGQTRNLELKRITDQWEPQKIQFEEFPMHYPSWHKIPVKRKAGVIRNIKSRFELTPHMQTDLWPKIIKGIEQRLVKIYTDNKSVLKQKHWVLNSNGTRDVEGIRSRRPANISLEDWDSQIAFWSDPKNAARAAQNARNRAKSMVICWQGSPSLAVLRDMQEMLRLKDLGPNKPTDVPYTDDEIMAMVRRGKQRGHIPGVGRILTGQGRDVLTIPESRCTHIADVNVLQSQHEVRSDSESGGGRDDEPGEDEDADEDEDVDGDADS